MEAKAILRNARIAPRKVQNRSGSYKRKRL